MDENTSQKIFGSVDENSSFSRVIARLTELHNLKNYIT
jgi:hypothetical protein